MPSFELLVHGSKNLFFRPGPRVRTPPGGLLRGLRFEIDFKNQVQIYLGLSEREVTPWFRRFTARAATAVDVGAAEGRYTLPLLARTGVRKVLACEPSERTVGLLTNLTANGLAADPRLEVIPRFVGAEETDDSITLDSLLDRIALPCFIKMDVEGAEADVLRGAPRLLALEGVSFVIEVHSAELEAECIRLLKQAGYRIEIIRNMAWRRLVPLPGLGPIGHNRWLAATNDPALDRPWP